MGLIKSEAVAMGLAVAVVILATIGNLYYVQVVREWIDDRAEPPSPLQDLINAPFRTSVSTGQVDATPDK